MAGKAGAVRGSRFVIVFTSSAAGVIGSAALRWTLVVREQRAVLAETIAVFTEIADSIKAISSFDPNQLRLPPQPVYDPARMTNLQLLQFRLATVNSATSALSIAAVFLACILVTAFARSYWPTVAMAACGWFSTAAVAVAIGFESQRAILALSERLQLLPRSDLPSMTTNLIVFAGLMSGLLWNGVAPGIIGGWIGSRARAWAESLPERPSAEPAQQQPSPAAQRLACACGTLNLDTATTCYACGRALGAADSIAQANG